MKILSTIIWLPIAIGFLLLIIRLKTNTALLKYFSLATSIISCILVFYLGYHFDTQLASAQFVENIPWLPNLNINYALGVDGFSLLLVLLTAIMTLTVIINNWEKVNFCAMFLIMQGLMCGVFLAQDALLFYVFFEAMMLPLFIIIGLWGAAHRIAATIKFILYTFVGSLFLLLALLYLYKVTSTFSIPTLQTVALTLQEQKWLFWALLFAFAVKVPMWPVHTWLPDAHTQAPTGGSVILAAITLKVGAYGMIRFLLPIVPDACAVYANVIIMLSLLAIIYIGLVSIVQNNLKRLIAYSSIAHMGFVTLGFFVAIKTLKQTTVAIMSFQGAFLQMLAHGLISGALFFAAGVLYKRMHTLKIKDFGGVVNIMPVFASFFMLFALANVGMPATAGFVGEFFVILSSAKLNIWFAAGAALTLVLAASYTLWMYKRVVFGEVSNAMVAKLKDLTLDEIIIFAILATLIMLIGIWPNLVLQYLDASTKQLVTQLCISRC